MLCDLRSTLVVFASLVVFGCGSAGDNEDDGQAEHADDSTDTRGETGGETDGESVCAVETRNDEFAIGLSKSGNSVRATFVSASPAPPIKGDNTWVLDITDLSGAPLAVPTITALPMMPDHGHGTPINAVVTALADAGRYELTPVNLFMTGYWQITIDVTLAGGEQDSLMFGFCVE
jgi:YtkA-like